MAATARKQQHRPKLTAEAVVGAATMIVDERGIEALSMRALASALGVEAMSLYNHVDGKPALLDRIAEAVLADMTIELDPKAPWIDRIRVLAQTFRRMALKHPGAFPLVFTRQLKSPEALVPLEAGLALLREAGFDGDQAVHIMRAFVAYQGGSLLREVGMSHLLGAATPDFFVAGTEELGDAQFPMVRALAAQLAACDHAAEYDFGLEMMLAGLNQMSTSRRKR